MEQKENTLLSDKETIPTDDLIFSLIGDKKNLWKSIMEHMKEQYPESGGQWKYYNDGKRWLFKMIWKKKTVFWISLIKNTFRITFWFPDRAQQAIESSELPMSLKKEFTNAKKYGSTRGLTLIINDLSDVENVRVLVAIRTKIK